MWTRLMRGLVQYFCAEMGRRAAAARAEGKRQAFNILLGLLPIEWVIFRNLDVIPVFDDNTLANR